MAVSNVWKVVQSWLDLQRFPPNQSKLAEALGVQRSAVSDWKSGKTRPNPPHLLSLSKLMEPTLGPRTYTALVMAVLADMGYAETGWEDRLPADFAVEPNPQHGYGEMRNIFPPEEREHVLARALSAVPDEVGDLVAADEQDQSISGEQEESETP